MISAWVGAPQNWHGDSFLNPEYLKFWERLKSNLKVNIDIALLNNLNLFLFLTYLFP